MRTSRSVFALWALPALSLAASLSDFTPRVSQLPSNCQTVYSATISGCTATDFTSGTCSLSCIQGLQAMTMFVQATCSGLNLQGTNVITAFLAGQGPASLCPNLNAALGSLNSAAPSSHAAPSSTGMNGWPAPAQTTTASSGTTSTTPSSTFTSTSASSLSSSTMSTTTIPTLTLTNTASLPTATSTGGSASQTTAAVTSSIASSAASNPNSNPQYGGSPFDAQAGMSSGASEVSSRTSGMLLAMAFLFVAGLW